MSARSLTTTCTLTLAALLLAGSAQAQTINDDRLEAARDRSGDVGRALGQIETPTFAEEGSLDLVLFGPQGESAYVVDASLTAFLAIVRVPQGTQITFGGIYGDLHRVTPEGAIDPESAGFVEGTWQLDDADQGRFDALIHRRTPSGGTEVGGLLRGHFSLVDGEIWIGGPPSDGPLPPSVDAVPAGGGTLAGDGQSVSSGHGAGGPSGGATTSASQVGGLTLANGRSDRSADAALAEPGTELPEHRYGYASALWKLFD